MEVTADYRKDVPSVRDQRDRQTCLAFAVTAAHNFHQSYANWFSVEYLFYHALQKEPGKNPDNGLTFRSAEHALRDDGQPEEKEWPYQTGSTGKLTIPATPSKLWTYGSRWTLHRDSKKVFEDIKMTPVIVGIRLSQGFYDMPSSPFLVDDTCLGFGGHAVLGVGSGVDGGESWLMIRNSWGPDWGDSGNAWLSNRFLEQNLIGHMKLG